MASHEHPDPERRRFQFGLKHLAVVITAFCLLFAVAASMGLAVCRQLQLVVSVANPNPPSRLLDRCSTAHCHSLPRTPYLK